MIENELLYKILDFEVNWNKYHLIKQYGYIFRLQQIIDLFNKLDIIDPNANVISNISNTTNLKYCYNFVKNGNHINYINDANLFEGVGYRLKNNIQNSLLKNKYPHFIDIDFDYQIIFQKLLILRCSLYKLQNKFNTIDTIENIEIDLEEFIYNKMFEKIQPEIIEIDSILAQLLNPYNKNINPNNVLHYNLDFNQFNIT
jgi:hypothetical protein